MEVNAVIDNLANKFGIAAEYVVPELVKYKICEHLIWGILGLICFIVIFVIYKLGNKKIKELIEAETDEYYKRRINWMYDDIFPYTVSISIFLIIGSIFFIICIFVIPWLIAPTGTAINYILTLLQ